MPWYFYVILFAACLALIIVNAAVLDARADNSVLFNMVMTLIGFAIMLFVLWATIDYDNGNLGIDQEADDGFAIATIFIVGILSSLILTSPRRAHRVSQIIFCAIATLVLMFVWAFWDDASGYTTGWILVLALVSYTFAVLIRAVCRFGDNRCGMERYW